MLDKALETARRLAEESPESILAAKELLKRGMEDAVTTAMSRELNLFNERLAAPEIAETVARFSTKR